MPPLRFTSCMSEVADPFCQALSGYLSEQLDRGVVFINDIPYPERLTGLQEGTLDVGWICGVDYVGRIANPAYQLLAALVMQGTRYQGQPVYYSDVIVRRDSPYKIFDELRGVRWAYNEPGSFSGFRVMLHRLGGMGEGVDFFGETVESGAHTASIQMIADRRADVAAIDSTAFDQVLRREPEVREKVRVVESLGPNPIPPWVVSRSLAAEERDALKEVFLGMYDDPRGRAILSHGLFEQFKPVEDSDYDPIRQIISEV